MATIALVLVFAGVTVLAARELLETKGGQLRIKARSKLEQARELRMQVASQPRGPARAVEWLNSGGGGLGNVARRVSATVEPGAFGQPKLALRDKLAGNAPIGEIYRTTEQVNSSA